VDAVIETAGVMAVPTYRVNEDGVELTFAINHLGHFLFTNLIMERLLAAKDGGVVVPYTSSANKQATLNVEDLTFEVGKTMHRTWEYQAHVLSEWEELQQMVGLRANKGGLYLVCCRSS